MIAVDRHSDRLDLLVADPAGPDCTGQLNGYASERIPNSSSHLLYGPQPGALYLQADP